MREIWKKVPGIPDRIEVSSKGRVRSFRRGQWKIIKGSVHMSGYHAVCISLGKVSRTFKVHRLIVKAFGMDRPELVCNHIDGNKLNNALDNLEVVSESENARHAFRLGLRKPKVGSEHYCAKLTEEKCIEIIQLKRQGVPHRELARRYGVAQGTLTHMLSGKSWKWSSKVQSALKEISRILEGKD